MKESEVKSKDKVMIPIRVSNELYKKIRQKVNQKKDEDRGYSINKYISELIEKNLRRGNNGK